MSKTYRLYCEICNWKKITDGSDVRGLTEVKKSKIQRGIPRIDPKTKKVVEPEWKTMPKQFKCPKCGRPVKIRRIANPQEALEKRLERDAASKEREEIKSQLMDEMKERYKDRRLKEIEQSKKDEATRKLARELEEQRLRDEIEKIEKNSQSKGFEIDEQEEDRPDGSETGS
jgi:predicted RNA-binding Zn-ribbon protein involved in translation (DUF1610 family)